MWTPKFSKQHYKERNCGQHCVAMITGLPVSVISSEINNNKGTCEKDVSFALRAFGWDADVLLNKYTGTLPKLCIIHICHHWAVYYDGIVYDSCKGIIPIQKYPHRIKNYLAVEPPKETSSVVQAFGRGSRTINEE